MKAVEESEGKFEKNRGIIIAQKQEKLKNLMSHLNSSNEILCRTSIPVTPKSIADQAVQ